MIEREHRVQVWGKRQTVTVVYKSKSVWEAVGDYNGETIRVKDRTERAALRRWSEAAKYRGA